MMKLAIPERIYAELFAPRPIVVTLRSVAPLPKNIPSGILPLDQLRPLEKNEDWPDEPGVYFLWSGPALMYVGMSKHLNARINMHINAQHGLNRCKTIRFDRISFMVCDEKKIASIEAQYIRTYRPPYNDKIPPCY